MRFDAKTLAEMRAAARKTMSSTLALVTVPQVDDGHGGTTDGTPVDGAATVCRIMPITGFSAAIERAFGGRVESRTAYLVVAPHDFAAASGNKLKIDGITYEVEAVQKPPSADVVVRMYRVYLLQ